MCLARMADAGVYEAFLGRHRAELPKFSGR
jgi:hypothetical protein